jgi:hypothetical protein
MARITIHYPCLAGVRPTVKRITARGGLPPSSHAPSRELDNSKKRLAAIRCRQRSRTGEGESRTRSGSLSAVAVVAVTWALAVTTAGGQSGR